VLLWYFHLAVALDYCGMYDYRIWAYLVVVWIVGADLNMGSKNPANDSVYKSFGGYRNFMHSYGLKPGDVDDVLQGEEIANEMREYDAEQASESATESAIESASQSGGTSKSSGSAKPSGSAKSSGSAKPSGGAKSSSRRK